MNFQETQSQFHRVLLLEKTTVNSRKKYFINWTCFINYAVLVERTARCTQASLCVGFGKRSDHRDLFYAVLPFNLSPRLFT